MQMRHKFLIPLCSVWKTKLNVVPLIIKKKWDNSSRKNNHKFKSTKAKSKAWKWRSSLKQRWFWCTGAQKKPWRISTLGPPLILIPFSRQKRKWIQNVPEFTLVIILTVQQEKNLTYFTCTRSPLLWFSAWSLTQCGRLLIGELIEAKNKRRCRSELISVNGV